MMQSNTVRHVLAMRFSALGDVALVVPVLRSVLESNPNTRLLMLSRQEYAGLFDGIERLEFIGIDLKKRHAGLLGIFRIFNMLRKTQRVDVVADLHGVLRTYLLRFLLLLIKKPSAGIEKGRIEKHLLTRKENKVFRPLDHTTDRYKKVFQKLGLLVADYELSSEGIAFEDPIPTAATSRAGRTAAEQPFSIGFAPFAKHATKMFNLDRFKEIIRHFDQPQFRLYLFGGQGAEKLLMEQWTKEFTQVVATPSFASLKEELELMHTLDVVVSMDSANMHLASLAGVPVVSLWGPTHPHAGFYGYNQDPRNAVQVNGLTCRPCSVFGGRSCWRGDHACMEQIAVEDVVEKINRLLADSSLSQ
jgi:ADP-heptose:LPS heptosyltransferase